MNFRMLFVVGLVLAFVGCSETGNQTISEPNASSVAEDENPGSNLNSKKSNTSTENGPREIAENDVKVAEPTNNPKSVQNVDGNGMVSVTYSKDYLIDLLGLERMHPFDIMKYKKIHAQLVKDDLLNEGDTHVPKMLSDEQILLVQSQEFLDSLKDRETVAIYLEAGVLANIPVPLESGVVNPFRFASGGTLLAGRLALENGVGVNIGGGYHHAKVDIGEGFCLFADVPIAIRVLQKEKLIERALIIDVDVHQGNGTAECLANDESTYTFSIHQGDIYPIPKAVSDMDIELEAGVNDRQYMIALEFQLDKLFELSKPDIVFIVGGCDTLEGDPLAQLEMTHQGIVDRDARIVAAAVKRKVPVVLTLAGGYSEDAWKSQYLSIKNLIETYGLAKKIDE